MSSSGHWNWLGKRKLTANEWKKARRFGDKYWLYIVTVAGGAPRLYCIQNPAAAFQEGEDIFATGFIVPEDQWRLQSRDRLTDQMDDTVQVFVR